MNLVACIPNFSEGRNSAIVEEIATAASGESEARLIHVDSSADANRTVMTIVGTPEGVSKAAFGAISAAVRLIDMTVHSGAHPRMGAADVCPIVPLGNSSMETCIDLAQALADRVGGKLKLAAFLYGRAALRPGRMELKNVRQGQYEGLEDRLRNRDERPDFGPGRFNAKSGAIAVGAREWLIAYNINLDNNDLATAKDIAKVVRGGTVGGIPGVGPRLAGCRAIGWLMPAYGCAQVSMNLVNFRLTPPHVAFETVRAQAEGRGLGVHGSEMVGLVPLSAMLLAGRHFRSAQGLAEEASEAEIVAAAIDGLGLNAVRPFDPQQQVLEYRLRHEGGIWAEAAHQILVE